MCPDPTQPGATPGGQNSLQVFWSIFCRVRVPLLYAGADCGSRSRGFKSHYPPHRPSRPPAILTRRHPVIVTCYIENVSVIPCPDMWHTACIRSLSHVQQTNRDESASAVHTAPAAGPRGARSRGPAGTGAEDGADRSLDAHHIREKFRLGDQHRYDVVGCAQEPRRGVLADPCPEWSRRPVLCEGP